MLFLFITIWCFLLVLVSCFIFKPLIKLLTSSWKDLNCPFRKDPNTHLIFLPTLLRWKSPQRLDGERVSNKDLVEMIFEDED